MSNFIHTKIMYVILVSFYIGFLCGDFDRGQKVKAYLDLFPYQEVFKLKDDLRECQYARNYWRQFRLKN